MLVPADRLREIAISSLETRGIAGAKAQLQVDVLVEAELRGLPSHGLQRLPLLVARIENGLVNIDAEERWTWKGNGFLTMDGQAGLGPVVLMAAMRELETAVIPCGIAMAAIRNANHAGMLAYYAEHAAERGMIGVVMSTSEALVHPYGGTQAMLGTNPVAIGIPTGDDPFILDFATSIVSMGKINNHALRGAPIPAGWAVDVDGRPTSDPKAARTGAIAPFGEAKGYGLGLAVELLVAVLAGSEMAPDVRGTLDDTAPATKGDLLILIDPAAGTGKAAMLSGYLQRLRASRPADCARPVLVPGDGARARRARALDAGIDVPDGLFQTLLTLAAA